MKKFIFTTAFGIALLFLTALVVVPQTLALTNIELLGKYIFFDNVSVPDRMGCHTCHNPSDGWTGAVSGVNLHQVAITGANPHTVGTLKPPSCAYSSFIVPFEAAPGFPTGYRGGAFWNGRSEGRDPLFPQTATAHIGDEVFRNSQGVLDTGLQADYERYLGPVADQALNPFGNPVEQNISRQGVCLSVASAKYAPLFEIAWGEPVDCMSGLDKSFKRIAVSLAAWQSSTEVNSFSSKRDIALRNEADEAFPLAGLTDQENRGHALFYSTFRNPLIENGVAKITNCALCHSERPGVDTGAEPFQLYTDFSYHLIGVPANPEIAGYPDLNLGLASHTGDVTLAIPGLPPIPFSPSGFQKTPTLRNVDKRPGNGFTKAYTHNGWFKSLESVVHFYNTADIHGATAASFGIARCQGDATLKDALKQNCWPAPEFAGFGLAFGPPFFLIGDMHLTLEDEAAIVAYLKTLTDIFTPKQPAPYK